MGNNIKSKFFYKDPIKFNDKSKFFKKNKFDISLYYKGLISQINKINKNKLKKVSKMIINMNLKKGTLYFVGNGGSLAIAHHLRCDFGKGLIQKLNDISTMEIGANTALSSALSNDFGFENSFLAEFEMYNPSQKDIVILISSSGNSKNIIKLAKYCKMKNIITIGLTGFMGGELKNLTKVNFHVNLKNYPSVEIMHQLILDSIFFEVLYSIS